METSSGLIAVDRVVVAAGPWTPGRGAARAPAPLEVAGEEREMWTFWYLQEGEIDVDPNVFVTADGSLPPVLHVDSHATLITDDGALVTDEQWGVYFKQDKHSVQGGAEPLPKGHDFQVDPYPTGSVEEGFPDLWCAALSHCMERFEGARGHYRQVRSGGVGAFTADNFPVFDHMLPNVYVAADSNHGYKMIAVGREDRPGAHRRALRPAAPVPLRAVRDRGPPPRVEQPLPLELRRPLPSHVVIGGGVNGLSVAWHLAERGADVVVLDKGRIGGGASGIAGGIIRNYYRSEAITELVRLSVEMFEEDPDAYGFRQSGLHGRCARTPGGRPRWRSATSTSAPATTPSS